MEVELTNTSQKLCVIGDPVLHSKSPLIQNAMLGALGLNYVYLCQPVKRGELPGFLSAARTLGYAGFNATMPHKEDLVPLMDQLDEDATLYGSVNTVCIREGKLYGYNTDGRGFLQSLTDQGFAPEGNRAVLLGAGGAAKAVALKLVQQEISWLTVCNRTPERAEALCAHSEVMSTAGLEGASLRRAVEGADLLVNCTSLGMAGAGGDFADLSFLDALPSHALVCDLVYHPEETALLAAARGRGLRGANGLGMLIHQAAFALEHFTGRDLDRVRLRAAAEAALKG